MRLIPASALVALALAACAAPPTKSPPMLANADCAVVDCQKMAEVNRKALLSGVQVIWVHAPQKKPDAGGSTH